MMVSSTGGNFVRHLSSALSSRCFHRLTAPVGALVPSLFATHNTPTRFALANASLSSLTSSETSQTHPHVSPYLSVDIRCRKHVADMLSEALLSFGASSTAIDEQDDNESSDEICINSIFPEGHDITLSVMQAADSVGLKEIPSFEVSAGEQCDWITKSQESFNSVKVTEGLWVVPEWRVPPEVQATNIILNPGLAFGTGEHPTTKLCLLLLHGSIKGGERFLDYGTGSGVLAIAALKLGCSLSVGIDIDPQAIASARQNAALNNIEPEKLQLHLVPRESSPADMANSCGVAEAGGSNENEMIPETEKYDIVVANILLNPLLDLAEDIISYGKPGSIIGLSGILSEQVPHIMERYSQFLEGISVAEMDDWVCVCGTKKRIPAAN